MQDVSDTKPIRTVQVLLSKTRYRQRPYEGASQSFGEEYYT
jgi:hypothetical protein